MSLSVMIAGCGDVGSALAQQLISKGYKVYGLRRNLKHLPPGIQGICADLSDPVSLQQLPAADIVVYSVAASQHDEAGYQSAYIDGMANLLRALPTPPRQLMFTSSSGVYHQNGGETVDETSPTEPSRFSGRIMLAAEKQVLESGIPASVVRFSGIYGPGRTHMLRQVATGIVAAREPVQRGNRIHRDDCAGFLAHLIEKVRANEAIEPVYLASDDDPAPLADIGEWLAEQLGVEITERKNSRRAGSKRCDNSRMKASGYRLKYPGYRDGYPALIETFRKES
ncbi:SDR family oxidoreductase [Marinobacterium jannaschii]|uniref:SDR family oxidoreductase n=1 Tax=Marinobacterium jannaschii TaxID=64970 RepID=UPI00056591DD|nr:SDR family oxidoreductase [Marinobacterium jannaschii]